MNPHRLAREIGVPPSRVYRIVRGKSAISADTALRLARYFRTSPQFWMNLQAHYDLEVARDEARNSIEKIQPLEARTVEDA